MEGGVAGILQAPYILYAPIFLTQHPKPCCTYNCCPTTQFEQQYFFDIFLIFKEFFRIFFEFL